MSFDLINYVKYKISFRQVKCVANNKKLGVTRGLNTHYFLFTEMKWAIIFQNAMHTRMIYIIWGLERKKEKKGAYEIHHI